MGPLGLNAPRLNSPTLGLEPTGSTQQVRSVFEIFRRLCPANRRQTLTIAVAPCSGLILSTTGSKVDVVYGLTTAFFRPSAHNRLSVESPDPHTTGRPALSQSSHPRRRRPHAADK